MSLLAGSFRAAVKDGGRRRPRASRWRWPRPSPGSASATPGVHIPHANAYPIAGRVRDYRPEGYPEDEPIVPHGMAVVADRARGVPVHLRRRAGAAPARGPAPRPRRRRATAPTCCPACSTALMRDIGIPNGLAEVGLRRGRRRRPRRRRHPAAAAVGHVTQGAHGRGPGARCSSPRWNTGEVTAGSADLVAELRKRGVTDVDDSALTRALYSSDASLYRVVPQVVVRPRARRRAATRSSTSRGPPACRSPCAAPARRSPATPSAPASSSTPLKHLNRVLSVDPEARTAVVQPGVVHADLQRAAGAARAAVRAGPVDAHPLHDRRDDRQQRLRLAGARLRPDRRQRRRAATSPGGRARRTTSRRGSARWSTSTWRTCAPSSAGSAGRSAATRSSTCCPSTGASVDRFLVGSEGTLALVREATVRLVEDAAERLLVVLGYPSMVEAADAVPALLAATGAARWSPARGWTPGSSTWCEARGSAVPELPARRRLAVRRAGRRRGPELAGRRSSPRAARSATGWSTDPAEAAALWRIREDGAGLAARSLKTPAYSGWEDAAVPPDRLGAWLRDFDELLREHGLDGVPYGHFGDGCVHVRIDFPFEPGDGRVGEGVPRLPHRLRAQAARPPRLAVRRARRRPGPLRAAAADVRRGVAPALRRGQGDLRPGQPAQPRQPGRPGAARRRPAAGARRGCRSRRCSGCRTTAASSATPCTAAPASASASRRRPTA